MRYEQGEDMYVYIQIQVSFSVSLLGRACLRGGERDRSSANLLIQPREREEE